MQENKIDDTLLEKVQNLRDMRESSEINLGEFYDELSRLILKFRFHGVVGTYIDVGCHVGDILDHMLSVSNDSEFVGYEPIPNLSEYLKKKYSDDDRVTIYGLALCEERGTKDFNYVTTSPGYSGLIKRPYDKPEEDENIQVNCDYLDRYTFKYPIKFLKIDVEGGEYGVISGGKHLITRDKPVIVFEHAMKSSIVYSHDSGEVFDLINRTCGLDVSLMDNYLSGEGKLSRDDFIKYSSSTEYQFVAHS